MHKLNNMQLESNEYTISSFLEYLEKTNGNKITGQPFNSSDVAQYCMRGYTPYRYGGQRITVRYVKGIKIITLSESEMKNKTKRKSREAKIS
jgi:hypothetical protein